MDQESNYRRKSSFDAPRRARQQTEQHKNTDCFVHALLEKQRKTGKASTLDDIIENNHTQYKEEDGVTETPTHSRLLTKKQLSDMAWGVRKLAKTLGSIRLKLKVKTVFLLTKAHDETLIGYTREVAAWLLNKERDVSYIVCVAFIVSGDGPKVTDEGQIRGEDAGD